MVGQYHLIPFLTCLRMSRVTNIKQVSAAIAGEAVGPILWSPLSQICGRSSVILGSLLGVLVFNIWGALMTRQEQFIPFILSRMFAGLCGAVPTV